MTELLFSSDIKRRSASWQLVTCRWLQSAQHRPLMQEHGLHRLLATGSISIPIRNRKHPLPQRLSGIQPLSVASCRVRYIETKQACSLALGLLPFLPAHTVHYEPPRC